MGRLPPLIGRVTATAFLRGLIELTQQFRGAANAAKLAVEAGQVDTVNRFGGVILAIVTAALERRGGIGDQGYVEAEIGCHARRCRNTVIGRQTHDDERADAVDA